MSTRRSRKAVLVAAVCGVAVAVFTVSAQAKWVEKPSPEFPIGVYYQGLEGSVVVSLTLDKSGRVTGSQVIRSSGHTALDNLARQASMQWRLSADSVLDTDINVGRLELIKFVQSNSRYAKAMVPGSVPFWALVTR